MDSTWKFGVACRGHCGNASWRALTSSRSFAERDAARQLAPAGFAPFPFSYCLDIRLADMMVVNGHPANPHTAMPLRVPIASVSTRWSTSPYMGRNICEAMRGAMRGCN